MPANIQNREHLEIFKPDLSAPLPSEQLVDIARGVAGDRVLLSFSGRDSLAAWLFCRDHGFDIIPYFCYTVPDLSYDLEMLDYYERFFGTHILRLPHPAMYALFRNCAWMPLDVWNIIYHSQLPAFEFADIEDKLARQFRLGQNYLSVVGIRAADNLMRHRLVHQMGPIGYKKRRYYYAIWDWKTADVSAKINEAGLKLSKSYLFFGSTGDGIDYKFLRFLKDNLPDDFQRVLDFFPLADIELFRFESVK